MFSCIGSQNSIFGLLYGAIPNPRADLYPSYIMVAYSTGRWAPGLVMGWAVLSRGQLVKVN